MCMCALSRAHFVFMHVAGFRFAAFVITLWHIAANKDVYFLARFSQSHNFWVLLCRRSRHSDVTAWQYYEGWFQALLSNTRSALSDPCILHVCSFGQIRSSVDRWNGWFRRVGAMVDSRALIASTLICTAVRWSAQFAFSQHSLTQPSPLHSTAPAQSVLIIWKIRPGRWWELLSAVLCTS